MEADAVPQRGRPRVRAWDEFSSSNVYDSASSGTGCSSKNGMSQDRLIVGVDFGTTYSGVAVVHSAKPDEIDIVKTWPGGNSITSDKVPTEITYEAPSTSRPVSTTIDTFTGGSDAQERTVRWGFQIAQNEPRLRCLKLFLDRSQRLPDFVSPAETATQLKKYNSNVMDAVTDYLAQLYRHTIDLLIRRYGKTFASQTEVEFVLTVPAVWSDRAKHSTLVAAERAGLGERHELKLISEPEAAAVYTLKTMQPSFLRAGDSFIVCDAGGGTVDIIAYRINQLSPLRIEESAIGTGALCGSTFLNYRFEDHVRSRLGAERFKNIQDTKPKSWNMALKNFEQDVKRNFDEYSEELVEIPFPGLPDDEDAGIESGFLIMRPQQLRDIFDPVVSQVVQLVADQANSLRRDGETVSGVILVGGFGQSNYLYQSLRSQFNSAPPPPYTERPTHATLADSGSIEVLQPLNAWTAVVRGAVLRGLEGKEIVAARKSRWHYGTSFATVFDASKHPIADRYWSPLWERWMVSDRMQWHIGKGDPLNSATPIAFHYTRNFRAGNSLVVEDDLIACELDKAPDTFSKDLTSVCTLTTDLSTVPKSLFTRLTTTGGIVFDNLDFELVMWTESAGLRFELCVDGRPYGRVVAEYH